MKTSKPVKLIVSFYTYIRGGSFTLQKTINYPISMRELTEFDQVDFFTKIFHTIPEKCSFIHFSYSSTVELKKGVRVSTLPMLIDLDYYYHSDSTEIIF